MSAARGQKEDVDVKRELKINRRKKPYEILHEESLSNRSLELDPCHAIFKPHEYAKTAY
jgi:hypothetical protein